MLRVPVLIIVFFQVGERNIDSDSIEAVVKARGPFVENSLACVTPDNEEA